MRFNGLAISIQSILLRSIELIVRSTSRIKTDFKPIWIIGVPRSGTTLVYQVMCKSFKSSYLTNRVAKRYRIALITRKFERFAYEAELHPVSFTSEYGKTKEASDPHEGGAFFYQFFPKSNPYCKDLDKKKRIAFRKTISSLTEPLKLFISKNTYHSLRIRALKDSFPQSKFIWVTRNKSDVIHSIVRARQKNNIPKEDWWSVNPEGWEEKNKLSEIEKISWQIDEIESIIEKDLLETKSRYLKVSYEEISTNPHKTLNFITKEFGIENELRDIESLIPEKFGYSKPSDDSLLNEIKNTIKNE